MNIGIRSRIGAGLLVVATFIGIEQKPLAAQPSTDPANTAPVAADANQAGSQAIEAQLQTIAAQLTEFLTRIERLEAIAQRQPEQSPPVGAMPMDAGTAPRGGRMAGMGSGAKPMRGGRAGMDMTGGGNSGMGGDPAIADQLAELHAKMQRLEGAIQQQSGASSGAMSMGGDPGIGSGTKPVQGKMPGMSGMGAGNPRSGGAPGAMKPAGETDGMGGGAGMGMMGMGKMEMGGMMGGMGNKGDSSTATPPVLPGFPDAPHLYHVGATGFFLDHSQHIALSTEQQMMLNQIKEKAALDNASADRGVQEAEQDLWTLTAADAPDNAQIGAKVAEIEKLKGDARLRFIGAIGAAANILSDEQREMLTGFSPPVPVAAPMASGMKDM